jgi:hypothetical protein
VASQREPIQLDDLEADHEYAVQYWCDGTTDASFTGTYSKFLRAKRHEKTRAILEPAKLVFELISGTEVMFEPKHRKCIMPTGRKRINLESGGVVFVKVEER